MVEQGAPGQTQTQRGRMLRVEARMGNLGGIQRLSKHTGMKLKPKWN